LIIYFSPNSSLNEG